MVESRESWKTHTEQEIITIIRLTEQIAQDELNSYLLYAIEDHYNDVTNLLIERGADIHTQDHDYELSPLLCASVFGNLEIFKLLFIEYNANIHAIDYLGRSALSLAARNGHLDVVKFLIQECEDTEEERADINATDHDGCTALLYAAQNGYLDVVKFLIQEDADIEIPDNQYGRTALLWAAINGHQNIVSYLITTKQANINTSDKDGKTPLLHADEMGHLHVVHFLVIMHITMHLNDEENPNINQGSSEFDYEIPLMWAVRKGALNTITTLVQHGADISTRDNCERTAFSWAASCGQIGILNFLFNQPDDIEIDQKDNIGITPLLWAAINGHSEIVNLLIEHGANINHIDDDGCTALVHAAQNGCLGTVKLLIQQGADINVADNEFHRTPFLWAAINGHLEIVNLLIEHGTNINHIDDDGYTALVHAAQNGCLGTVKSLIQQGADIYCKNNKGENILDVAPSNITNIVALIMINRHLINDKNPKHTINNLILESNDNTRFQIELYIKNNQQEYFYIIQNYIAQQSLSIPFDDPQLAKKILNDITEVITVHNTLSEIEFDNWFNEITTIERKR